MKAWNLIRGSFIEVGHEPLRLNSKTLDLFLHDIRHDSHCCVVGASTIPLIKAILNNQLKLTVIDFSQKMYDDLQKVLNAYKIDAKIFDIIHAPPAELFPQFQFILADQVINCFARKDVSQFFANAAKLLVDQGELRIVVKMGFYELDKLLVAEGKKRNTLPNFYNTKNNTINYSFAFEELIAIGQSIKLTSNISLDWHQYRGEEARFTPEDFTECRINEKVTDGRFKVEQVLNLPDLDNFVFYRLKFSR